MQAEILSDTLHQLYSPVKTDRLTALVNYSYCKIISSVLENHLIPATVGRADDENFDNNQVWLRDNNYGVNFTVNPLLVKYFPEITSKAQTFGTATIRAGLKILIQNGRHYRLDSRPILPANQEEFHQIDRSYIPYIKYDQFTNPIENWDHDQIDSLAVGLRNIALAIKMGLPILQDDPTWEISPALATKKLALYIAGYGVERAETVMMWEGPKAKSSLGVRMICYDALKQISTYQTWMRICDNERKNEREQADYNQDLATILQSRDKIESKIFEDSPYCYTNPWGHDQPGDLEVLVAFADQVRPRIRDNGKIYIPSMTRDMFPSFRESMNLEGSVGLERFSGDLWKRGVEKSAQWFWGNSLAAEIFLIHATHAFADKQKQLGKSFFEAGFKRLEKNIFAINRFGYLPELATDGYPNNNQLVMALSSNINACLAAFEALSNLPPQEINYFSKD